MKLPHKPAVAAKVVTITTHLHEQIELLSQTKTHGIIYPATGGVHVKCNDLFMGMTLKQGKVLHITLAKEKKVHERQ